MKNIILISFIILSLLACKKSKFSPEGPTDVRVRNLSDLAFEEVIVKTSEKEEDKDTLGNILSGAVSEYFRYTKAYPKAEISCKIDINGTLVLFSTGTVDFTYMQYIGQDRITLEVYISDMVKRVLKINNVILDEPLVLK